MIERVLSVVWWIAGLVFSPISLAVLFVALAGFYYYYTKNFGLWASLGVPGPPSKLPWGSEKMTFIHPLIDFEEFLYKHGKKFCGYMEFQRPVFYTGDPELIRAITIKDFNCFVNRREDDFSMELKDMLFNLKDKQWKDTRSVMTATFSASKLKGMHQLCMENSESLIGFVRKEMDEHGQVEVKDAFGRFTMDNIASCAFGVNSNSFVDPNSKFVTTASKLFAPPGVYGTLRIILLLICPQIGLKLPDPMTAVMAFFSSVVLGTINNRQQGGLVRRDFLQLMLDSKDEDGKRNLSDCIIVYQCAMFFMVGYDTTALLLTFAAYSLATNPECQRRAHEEIREVLERHGGKMTYEAVSELTYLDRVFSETLRLYPPATRSERVATKDYPVPGTSIVIPKDTVVQFPIYCLHRDADHFPDPLKFDPDRFLTEVKESRHPCSYIPFGSGPRNCIAMRFALFEAKVALSSVLQRFEILPSKDTPPAPMQFQEKTFLLYPAGGKVHLKLSPREEDA